MILGLVNDAQFGPAILLGMGGIHAEVLRDFVTVMPPFDVVEAARQLDRLKLRRLLDGSRGAPPVDAEAFCRAAADFSAIAPHVADLVREIDINPVKVLEKGCVALDALFVPAASRAGTIGAFSSLLGGAAQAGGIYGSMPRART